jgi:hypothetical protein
MGYWWVELGGEDDSIHDTEQIRDELLKIVYGLWDHIKNHGEHGAENWTLEWIEFLPGKRESVRYVGDHLMTQNDVEAEGRFGDLVAYGGWAMDDHHPAGFRHRGAPTTFYKTPSPYGIPYRSLYSANVENLMFAGRCASFTHAAMSSARVMGTGASMGQAVGTAAAIALREKISPREAGKSHPDELQQSLLRQDAYLPWVKQRFCELTAEGKLAASAGDPEPLRDGINRPVGEDPHSWQGSIGDSVEYTWKSPRFVSTAVLIVDSALAKQLAMSYHQWDQQLRNVPEEVLKDFRVEVRRDGKWVPWRTVQGNYQRLVKVDVGVETDGVRVIFDATWGAEVVTLYAFYVE